MNYETITVTQPQEHTVLVTLNRSEVANAMNTQMGLDLLAAFGDLRRPTSSAVS